MDLAKAQGLAPPPELDPETVSVKDPDREEEEEDTMFADVGRIMQVLRIARMMRIFKLARRSVGLQSMAHTVKSSWKVGALKHKKINDRYFLFYRTLGCCFLLSSWECCFMEVWNILSRTGRRTPGSTPSPRACGGQCRP